MSVITEEAALPSIASRTNRWSRPSRGDGLRIGIICGITQWVLLLVIQIGDLFGYLLPPAARSLRAWSTLAAAVPFLQAQNILVAAVLGVLAYFAAWSRVTRWILFIFLCAESAGLLLDQVYYKVCLDHFHLGMIEGGQQFNVGIFLGSFVKETDWIFCCSSAVAIAGSIWLACALRRPLRHPVGMRWILVAAAVIGLAGIPKASAKAYGHVNEHPLIALVREFQQRSVAEIVARRMRAGIHRQIHSFDPSVDRDPRLAALLAASHPRNPHPNVVMIVMESVGAVDLLGPGGLPSPEVTPHLARLARNGITFNSIYTTFPGTTRSLVSLHTGGRQLTSGYMNELQPDFSGPLLAGYLGRSGYATALFSSERLDGESTDIFLEKAGYQKYYDFSRDTFENRQKRELNSWGGREEYTLELMENWISHADAGKPFYLEYMTVATHHPYSVPPEYPVPEKSQGRHSDYLNALNYVDTSIGSLLDFLAQRDLLKNTVIAVTGDHGEAFGDLHTNNFLHKNFIYDENVRDFLLLWDGQLVARKLTEEPVVSRRVGKNGDIMASLLALLDLPAADIPGRDLLAENFASEPVYFHKMAPPEMMGLRDGRWKFIDEIRSNQEELYDLAVDPTEQTNLAAGHPEMVSQYREMCQQWYVDSEREFVSYARETRDPRPSRDTLVNARTLTVGYWDKNAGLSSFVESGKLHPRQHAAVMTNWIGDADTGAMYFWKSPSGQTFFTRPLVTGEPHMTYSPFQGQDPMESGAWSVELRVNGGFHLAARFSVKTGPPRAE